jgi:small subunit ribosomal protein S27Ae
MAVPAKGGAKKDTKGAGSKAKKPSKRQASLYEVSGGKVSRKNKTCPKCGPGFFMAKHKDRDVCGKCSYVEFRKN